MITLNSAVHEAVGTGGSAGGSVAAGTGTGGTTPGKNGTENLGHAGEVGLLIESAGGGMAIFGKAKGDNPSVTGNTADVFPNIDGTLGT